MEKVLSKVKSKFNKDKVKELVIKYLQVKDVDELYEYVEGIASKQTRNEEIEKLRFDLAKDKDLELDKYGVWDIISSKIDTPEEFRLYLNLKGKDKADMAREYIARCKEMGIPFKFKYNRQDGRYDELIFLSSRKNLGQNVEILCDTTKNMELGILPEVVGEYTEGIGISEDSTDKTKSYTQSRLLNIPIVMQKYILDNREKIIKYCSEEEKEIVDALIETHEDEIETIEMKKRKGTDVSDTERLSELNITEDGFEAEYVIKGLRGVLKRAIADNPEVLDKLAEDYDKVSKEFDISSNYIFSKKTEQELECETR